MQNIPKLSANFTKETSDLKTIYITFIRPVLEQSAPVWHSSLTADNASDLERIQKAAVRLIMGSRHTDYVTSLRTLKLETLVERRENLCLNLVNRTKINHKMKYMFPLRKEMRSDIRRHTEKYHVKKTNTERFRKSAITYMQNLLNQERKKETKFESY